MQQFNKILITGGDGFLGRNIYENLCDKYNITKINRYDLDLLNTKDVGEYLKNNKFDIVLHTANYDVTSKISIKDPKKVVESNLRMFFNLAKYEKYYSKLLNFGSGAEYNQSCIINNVQESYIQNEDIPIPLDSYGFSKYIINNFIQQFDNKFYNFVIFAIFGKYENWYNRFISNALGRVINDMPIMIYQNAFIDYMYIDDFIKIIEWFINSNPKFNTYNICSGKLYGLNELASKIQNITKKDTGIIIKEEGLKMIYGGNNDRLMKEINGFEFMPIDDGIRDLYNWYKNNTNVIKKEGL